VRVWYAPGSVWLGLAVSGLALVVSVGGLVAAFWRRAGASQ
jgi:hypothetical protein